MRTLWRHTGEINCPCAPPRRTWWQPVPESLPSADGLRGMAPPALLSDWTEQRVACFYTSQGFTNDDAISSKCLTLRVASFA
jgi:hypothetical protein